MTRRTRHKHPAGPRWQPPLIAVLAVLLLPAALAAEKPVTGADGEAGTADDLVTSARGFSRHRPSWVHPVSYSPDLVGHNTETVYQISAKQRLFGTEFYFGFTQKSFWQVFDKASSSPFRETNYNPELFYRWAPERLDFHGLGLDLGVDHESNGRSHPESRSWNRVFGALFLPRGQELYYLQAWWRVPERAKRTVDDPRGDDNPNISDFYGYAEFHYRRQFSRYKQMIHTMLRANPRTGRGAIMINWSIPAKNNYTFWTVQLWQGYGESLIDHDRETTRIGIGMMLTR